MLGSTLYKSLIFLFRAPQIFGSVANSQNYDFENSHFYLLLYVYGANINGEEGVVQGQLLMSGVFYFFKSLGSILVPVESHFWLNFSSCNSPILKQRARK